jgi:hypothetical protein
VTIEEYAAEPHFWIGRLSRTITLAVADLRDDRPRAAREHLQATINEFLRCPVASDELKASLKADLRRR